MKQEVLVCGLSRLLDRAIATQGELTQAEWEEMEALQRRAYAVKHPEVLGEAPPSEARITQLKEALQRLIHRTELLQEQLEKRNVALPLWTVITIERALELAEAALSPSEAPSELEGEDG